MTTTTNGRELCYLCGKRPPVDVGPYWQRDGLCRQCVTEEEQMTPDAFIRLCSWLVLGTMLLGVAVILFVKWMAALSTDGWQNVALVCGGALVVLLTLWCLRLERREGQSR